MHNEQDYPQLTNVLPCRHDPDTTDLCCIFDLEQPTGWLVGDRTGGSVSVVWVRLMSR